jgi:hypothetical protein
MANTRLVDRVLSTGHPFGVVVRATNSHRIPGPCFQYGAWELVERDLTPTIPGPTSSFQWEFRIVEHLTEFPGIVPL